MQGQTSEKEERETRCDVVAVSRNRDVALRVPFHINNEGMGAGARWRLKGEREKSLYQSVAPRNCVV